MTIDSGYVQLKRSMIPIYGQGEATYIATLVMERVTGKRGSQRMMAKDQLMNVTQLTLFKKYQEELLAKRPVQYVLNEAFFYESDFYVDENVLIPRSETEELVQWVIDSIEQSPVSIEKIIDIGTGSGCIPVSIRNKIDQVEVHALDVSEKALDVAKKNATNLDASIHFHKADILNQNSWEGLPCFDIIISNPPYVRLSEAAEMKDHVLNHEPHLALFVPDEDALIFYKAIVSFAKVKLNKNGILFLEINEHLGASITRLLEENGFHQIELRKDMQQKDRMIKARL